MTTRDHGAIRYAESAPGTHREVNVLNLLALGQLIYEPLTDRVRVIVAAVVVDAVTLDDDRPLTHTHLPSR